MVAAHQRSFEAERSLCNALRENGDGHDRDQSCQDLDDKILAINAEPRHKNMDLEKTWKIYSPHPTEWAGAKKRKRQSCGSSWRETNNKPAAMNLG